MRLPVPGSPLDPQPADRVLGGAGLDVAGGLYVDGPARHGELLSVAARHIAVAGVALARQDLNGPQEADQALAAYRELVHALRGHAWRVFGPRARAEAVRYAVTADRSDAAAIRAIDALTQVVNRRPELRVRGDSPVTQGWLDAAVAVRGATELLATHHHPVAGWRTPDSVLLDTPPLRRAGMNQNADLVLAVADAEPALRIRARQAGLRHHQVQRRLPDMGAVRDAARRLRDHPTQDPFGADPTGLHATTGAVASLDPEAVRVLAATSTARPPLRREDPIEELTGRLTELRLAAWRMVQHPDASAAALADLAGTGLRINEALSLLTTPPGRPAWSRPDPAPAARIWVEPTARVWRRAWVSLRELRSPAPPVPVIRAHTEGVRELLTGLAPFDPVPGALDAASHRRLVASLARGSDAFAEVAAWNAATVRDLLRRRQLFLPARSLTGHEVSDHPDLAAAKLANGWAPARPEWLRPLLQAYDNVQADAGHAGRGGLSASRPGPSAQMSGPDAPSA